MTKVPRPTRRWFEVYVTDFKLPDDTIIDIGDINDGEYLLRDGDEIVGGPGGGGGGQTDTVTGSNGITNTGDNVDADLEPTYGSSANTVCEGDDSRLSDARTPTGAAGGDLSGTYPNPSVIDDSHNHGNGTLTGVPGAGIDTSAIHTGDAAGGDLSGTYPNPDVTDDSHNHTVATLPATMPPSAHAIDGAAHTGNLSAEDILVDKIGAATYDDIKNYLAATQASGIISGGTMTDLGGFVLQVAAGTGMIRASNSGTADVLFFDWAQDNDVKTSGGAALTADATNYIYVDYNGGSPVVYSETSKTAQGRDKFYLGRVFPEGTELHIVQAGQNITELAKRVQSRFTGVNGELVRASGSVIAETGQRYITSTAGVQYAGLTRNTTLAQNTSGADHFDYYSYIAGSWTEVSATQTTNSQYNDVSVPGAEVLANLTSNRYAVDWVYVDHDGHLMVVYGRGDYTLSNAEHAQPPSSLPDHIADLGFLAAKVITQEGATNWYGVGSAYDTAFTPSGAAIHNELSALQGGTSDEYYHLTAAEYSNVSGDLTVYDFHADDWISDAAAGSVGGVWNFLVDGATTPSGLEWFTGGTGTLTVNTAEVRANGDLYFDVSTIAPAVWCGWKAYIDGLAPPVNWPIINCNWIENVTLASGAFTNATMRCYIRDHDSADTNKDMIGTQITNAGQYSVIRNLNNLTSDTSTTGDTVSPWRALTNQRYLRLAADRLSTGSDAQVASGRTLGRAKYVATGNTGVSFERRDFSITDRMSYTWQLVQNGTSNITCLISSAQVSQYKA